MNTNKFFSFSRFYLLMRNDILLNYKRYLFTIVGAFILGFIILYVSMPQVIVIDNNFKADGLIAFGWSRYLQIFIMCLFGLGAFVGSAFSELSNKVKTSNYLLIPGSTFEKFLCQFVLRALVGTAIFLFIFWLDAHLARFAALSRMVDQNNQLLGPEKFKIIEKFHYSMFLIKDQYPIVTYYKLYDRIAMILGIFSIGMYLFSVKLFFKKMGLVKTIISLVALFYLLAGVMILFSHIFYPESVGFDMKLKEYTTTFHNISNGEIFIYSICYLSSLFLLPLGYFKLKEKQV